MTISNFVLAELDRIAKAEGFIDYKIEQEAGSKHGDGFVAKMLAVTLTGKRKIGNEITTSELPLMCKMLPENLERRDVFESELIFEHEIFVYDKVLRALEQFQREKSVPIDERFTEFPKCYAAVSDGDKGEQVIIMENLKSKGFGLLDKTKVDYDAVCLYMKVLGKLHAVSFALRDQKPEVFDEIASFEDLLVRLMSKGNPIMHHMLEGGIDKALSNLDQSNERKIVEDMKTTCVEEVTRLLKRDAGGKFCVLGHGDSWNNNLFYSNDGTVSFCLL